MPFDATVRISLDTNLCMIKENPEDGPSCYEAGRWFRDPEVRPSAWVGVRRGAGGV